MMRLYYYLCSINFDRLQSANTRVDRQIDFSLENASRALPTILNIKPFVTVY